LVQGDGPAILAPAIPASGAAPPDGLPATIAKVLCCPD